MGSKAGSASKVRLNSFDDLFGGAENTSGEQIIHAKLAGAVVYHCQQDALNLQLLVNLPFYLAYGLDKLLQSFHGQVCRLNRNEYAVGAGKGIYGNHSKRGHTVDQNIIEGYKQVLPGLCGSAESQCKRKI